MLLAVVMALSLMPISSFADEEYDILVGGVQITDENKDNVTGDGITGTVSYDPGKKILTLNGATITAQDGDNKIAIRAEQDLKIKLIGSNTIKAEGATKDNIGISTGNDQDGYYNLSVFAEEGASLEITAGDATQGNSVGIRAKDFTLYSGTVTVTAGTHVDDHVSYGASFEEMYLYDGTLTAKGEKQAIKNRADSQTEPYIYPGPKIEVAENTSSPLQEGDRENIYSETTKHVKISPTETVYPIWVGDQQISEGNKDNILNDGEATVKYDPASKKLTLNGADVQSNQYYGISSRIPLTIELIGKNYISVTGDTNNNNNNNKGIEMYDDVIDERVDLTITGEETLTINSGESTKGGSFGIWAKNLTVNSTGKIEISSGSAKTVSYGVDVENFTQNDGNLKLNSGESEDTSIALCVEKGAFTQNGGELYAEANGGKEYSAGIHASDFTQNNGTVGAFAYGNNSYGVKAENISIKNSSIFFSKSDFQALSSAPTIEVQDPSIIVSEQLGDEALQKKIDADTLNNNFGTYRWVSITPESELESGRKVTIEQVQGATVTIKSGDRSSTTELDNLKDDDIIEVDVKVTDSKKELDMILYYDVDDDQIDENDKLYGKTFVVWKNDVKVKAVLKDKPVAPSTGGGGGGGTSRSSVRPGESTATTNDPKKDPAPNVTPEANEVRLTIDSKLMKKGSENVVMDAAPFIRDGRTMVPLRYVAEALGLKVSWDAKTKTVTLSNDKNQIVVPTNSLTMQMNGEKVQSDVLPVLQGGRIYLSISNIGKALGLEQGKEIRWDAAEKTVILSVK